MCSFWNETHLPNDNKLSVGFTPIYRCWLFANIIRFKRKCLNRTVYICTVHTRCMKSYKNAEYKRKILSEKKNQNYCFILGASVKWWHLPEYIDLPSVCSMFNVQCSSQRRVFLIIIYMTMYRIHWVQQRNGCNILVEHSTWNDLWWLDETYSALGRFVILCICVYAMCELQAIFSFFSHFLFFFEFIIFFFSPVYIFQFILQFLWMHELHCTVVVGSVLFFHIQVNKLFQLRHDLLFYREYFHHFHVWKMGENSRKEMEYLCLPQLRDQITHTTSEMYAYWRLAMLLFCLQK